MNALQAGLLAFRTAGSLPNPVRRISGVVRRQRYLLFTSPESQRRVRDGFAPSSLFSRSRRL